MKLSPSYKHSRPYALVPESDEKSCQTLQCYLPCNARANSCAGGPAIPAHSGGRLQVRQPAEGVLRALGGGQVLPPAGLKCSAMISEMPMKEDARALVPPCCPAAAEVACN